MVKIPMTPDAAKPTSKKRNQSQKKAASAAWFQRLTREGEIHSKPATALDDLIGLACAG